jgi:hypothetical protein
MQTGCRAVLFIPSRPSQCPTVIQIRRASLGTLFTYPDKSDPVNSMRSSTAPSQGHWNDLKWLHQNDNINEEHIFIAFFFFSPSPIFDLRSLLVLILHHLTQTSVTTPPLSSPRFQPSFQAVLPPHFISPEVLLFLLPAHRLPSHARLSPTM